ncbi:hypothetical protein ACP4OV_016463 [Aristida adscensionis]
MAAAAAAAVAAAAAAAAAAEMAAAVEEQQQNPIPPNPLFPNAPWVVWQLYDEDFSKMAKSFTRIMDWMGREIAQRGVAVTRRAERVDYTFHLTSDVPSFFIIAVKLPAGWREDNELVLPLVFSFRDLYLVGFMSEGVWHFFNGAKLEGSGHDVYPEAFEMLEFSADYWKDHFESTLVSWWTLAMACDCLMNHHTREEVEVRAGVYQFIVTLSEARRFQRWRAYLKYLFENGIGDFADNNDRKFSLLFQNWSTTGQRARRGAARFSVVPVDGFTSYAQVLQNIDVALCQPPDHEL